MNDYDEVDRAIDIINGVCSRCKVPFIAASGMEVFEVRDPSTFENIFIMYTSVNRGTKRVNVKRDGSGGTKRVNVKRDGSGRWHDTNCIFVEEKADDK